MAVVKKDNSFNPFGLDEGTYNAQITKIEAAKGNFGEFLKWQFKIMDPLRDGEPVEPMNASGLTPVVFKEGDKLDKWLLACGIQMNDGDDFDTDDLQGIKVRALVEVKKKGDKSFPQITKIFRSASKKTVRHEEEEEEAPAPKAKKPVPQEEVEEKPAPKKARPPVQDEEPEEKPAPKKPRPAPVEEDEEAPAPKKAKAADDDDESLWSDFDNE